MGLIEDNTPSPPKKDGGRSKNKKLPNMKPPALSFLNAPILIDARPILFAGILSFLAMGTIPPARDIAPMVIVQRDTVFVTLPPDSLSGYILAEMRKVETRMLQSCQVIPESTDPFEVAIFEVHRREGYRPRVYRCPAGLETIGLGDVIDTPAERVLKSTGLAFSDARAKLYANMYIGAAEINSRFPGQYSEPCQWLALSLLGHSIGWDRLARKYPAFYAEIAAGKPSARWLKYCRYTDARTGKSKRSGNLARTRNVEWLLFNGDYSGLRPLHVDATRIAGHRWKEGKRVSMQKLGRE